MIYKDPAFLYEDFCVIDTECFPRDRLSASQFDDLKRREFWTACYEGRTVGFMSAEVAGNSAHLSRIAVLSAYRGKGIASRMMDLLLTFCEKACCKCVTLYVETTNSPAIRLYEKYGFTVTQDISQFVVPIRRILSEMQPVPPRIFAIPAMDDGGHEKQRSLVFTDEHAHPVGACVLDPEFPGCLHYALDDPDKNLPASLAALNEYLNPNKDTLILTIGQLSLVQACRSLHFPCNYALFRMDRELPYNSPSL